MNSLTGFLARRLARCLALLLLAILCGLGAPSARAAEQVVLQLKWHPQFQFAGYYAADKLGYFAAEGLAVTIRPRQPGPNPVDVVLAGQADFGVSGSAVVLSRLRGRPVVLLAAVFQHAPLVLLTRSEDGILGPSELKGRRIMLGPEREDALLLAMLRNQGLGPDDFIRVPHTFSDTALIDEEVDAVSAYVTNQPFQYRRRGVAVNIINPVGYGFDFYGDTLFTSEALARRRPDLVAAMRRASLKGWRYALDHPEQVIDWLIADYGSTKSRDYLAYEAGMTRRMIMPNLIEIGHVNPARLNWIADVYRAEGLAPPAGRLDGLLFDDLMTPQVRLPDWVRWLGGGLGLLGAASFALLALNRRLKRLVAERTRELERARDRLQYYLDIVDKYVLTSATDLSGRITYVSSAFARATGYDKAELLGRTHGLIRHPDNPDSLYQEMWSTVLAGRSWHREMKNLARDGSTFWVESNIEPTRDHDGTIIGFTAVRIDITDKKRIEELSVTDRLTGLFNRFRLDEVLAREFGRFERYGRPLGVILADVDHFKQINDSLGHGAGDRVLAGLARVLADKVRAADVVGRWGGEEFLILCPETDLEGALMMAGKLRAALGEAAVEGLDLPAGRRLTASFGVAVSRPGDTIDSLISRADQGLYRAKNEGRDRIRTIEGVGGSGEAAPEPEPV
ncbi:ABC transporter substrate-binding protein [Roseospirillum parvum]|nr:ABC transporter substrate-binding protein [Roseospirillum parvum]